MKKIFAIVVAVMMVMALSVSVFAEEVVYSMTETVGQGMENLPLADGAAFSTGDNGDNYARIATNWVGGGSAFNDIVAAVQTADAVVRVTYTGTMTKIGFQSESGSYEMVDVTDVTEVDGKNVAIIPCADIVAAAPVALSGSFGGWANFMMDYTEGGMLYGFEVVTGYEAGAAAPAEEAAPAEDAPAAEEAPAEAPAADNAAAPSTGIAIMVIPAVVALGAVAVSKKH